MTLASEGLNSGKRSTRCSILKLKKIDIFLIVVTIQKVEQKITIFTKKITLLVQLKLLN